MELKTGYKQTDLGIIPDDWALDQIGSLVSIQTGNRNTEDRVDDGIYPFFVRSQTVERINSFSFDGEAVLTAGDGVGTGKIFHYINGKFDAHQRVYRITKFDSRLTGYYFFLYFSNNFYNRIMQLTAKSSVDSVRREMIAKMLIPLPPVSEQEAIAEALSDVDDLIESLERLIAKKRLIKQGAMQELLTGKRRLPGFDDEWKLLPLKEVCHQIVDGTHFTPHYVESGIPFYSVENVVADDFANTKFISFAEHQQLSKRSQPKKGDILLTRIGSIGETKFIDWDVNASIYVSLALLRVNELIDPSFLYCYSKTPLFVTDLEDRSLMNATPKKINMNEIGNVHVPVPTLSEQHAIATILLDVEAEISSLETRLGKVRQVKRGMMQQLLTGEIRLVAQNVITFKPKAVAADTAKGHNQHFNEALVLSVLTAKFASLEFPLGRKRRTKLTYLFHRRREGEATGFLKKAAGPYNPSTRYKGAEGIAVKNGYVEQHKHKQLEGFIAGEKSGNVYPYFEQRYETAVLDWLEQFRFTKNDDLELLTTVDMAIVELRKNKKDPNLQTIKKLIQSEPEWAPKLDRSIFSDDNIKRAIDWSMRLFGDS